MTNTSISIFKLCPFLHIIKAWWWNLIKFLNFTNAFRGDTQDFEDARLILTSPACKWLQKSNTAWKVSRYGVFSGPYFPVFGLNMEIYRVNIHIQSEYRKTRTRKNSVFGHFSHSASNCKKKGGHVVKVSCEKLYDVIFSVPKRSRSWMFTFPISCKKIIYRSC